MEKKTIGGFIAALRKANGMTQQEIADRLNVSNKAVSRWERDECAPDLSLIPAIAELFDVTCDELLKGERIFKEQQSERSEPKVERQLKALVNRSISSFKMLIWISLALSIIGMICMFGISYGFYRPIIGFAVMMLFAAAAFIVAIIAVNKMKEAKTDNELLENADSSLMDKFNNTLGTLSFAAFFAVFCVILLSLPLIFFTTSNINSVLSFKSYFFAFFIPIVLVLALIFLTIEERYIIWITEQQYSKEKHAYNRRLGLLNLLQLGAVVLAGILFILAPYCNTSPHGTEPLYNGLIITGLVLLGLNIVCFIIFRKQLMLAGIRNLLMIPSSFMINGVHSVGFYSEGKWGMEGTVFRRYDIWHTEYLLFAVVLAIFIALVFKIIDIRMQKQGCCK